MSEGESKSTSSHSIPTNEWNELEIPFGKIKDKWNDYYCAQLEEEIDRVIKKGVLLLYFKAAGIDQDSIYKKETALDDILDKDESWGHDLYAATWFSKGISLDLIKECYKKAGVSITSSKYSDFYDELQDDRVGMVALIRFVEPRVLRDLRALDYCNGKAPQSVAEEKEGNIVNAIENSANDVVDELESYTFRDYDVWHHFEHNGNEYLLIKRQINDDVERQASGNLEEEPAEFVVLKFGNDRLEIFSENKKVASRAQRGVNESVDDVEFDDSPDTVSRNRLVNIVSKLEENDDDTLVLVGIKVSSSPLPKHPSIRLKGDDGISKAIQALRQKGYDLTNPVDDIESITVEFDGKEYKLHPRERTTDDGEIEWILRYSAGYLSGDEKAEFESQIRCIFDFDIPVRFEKV